MNGFKISNKEFLKFALGAVNLNTQRIMELFHMTEMVYLEKESRDEFGHTIKPVNFNKVDMKLEDRLGVTDNVEMGYVKVTFNLDNCKIKDIYYMFISLMRI